MVDGLYDLGVVLVKVDVVPNKEYIHRPNAAAVVLLAAEMLVQPADQSVGVEELFGGLAQEFLLYDIIELFVPEPYPCGNGEAELLLFGGRFGHMADRCLAQGVFCIVFVDSQLRGQRGSHLEHLFVEEGHAQLKGVRHTHTVCLEQNVTRHPQVDVEVLHFGNVVILAAAVVVLSGVVLRRGSN